MMIQDRPVVVQWAKYGDGHAIDTKVLEEDEDAVFPDVQ